jgi:hypothetical protein
MCKSAPIHWRINGLEKCVAASSTDSYKRINGRTYEVVGKVDGKVTVTTRVAISADGKTLTATQTDKNAQGQTVNNVIVAGKQ